MRIEIRSDSVHIDGYVNAVGRDSRTILTPHGKAVEQIEPRAFDQALSRASNVDLLLNHDSNQKLGSTADGNLELYEDNIGLRAVAVVTEADVIEKARKGELRGWSFGMYVNHDKLEERADNVPRRIVDDLDIFEVSLIDTRLSPAYCGTSVETRAGEDVEIERRALMQSKIVMTEQKEQNQIDYSDFESRINNLKK